METEEALNLPAETETREKETEEERGVKLHDVKEREEEGEPRDTNSVPIPFPMNSSNEMLINSNDNPASFRIPSDPAPVFFIVPT
jgi:hypothetical protein